MIETQYTPEQLATFDQLELQHRQLAGRNPVAAAQFYANNERAIDAARTRHAQGAAKLMPDIALPHSATIDDVLNIPKAYK